MLFSCHMHAYNLKHSLNSFLSMPSTKAFVEDWMKMIDLLMFTAHSFFTFYSA